MRVLETLAKNSIQVNFIKDVIFSLNYLEASLYRYISHKVREKHQKNEMLRLYKDTIANPSKIVVVIDHKQKILSEVYRESQAAYFSKKGMSLLGTMELHTTFNETNLQIEFCDFIIDGSSTQDAEQVQQLLVAIVHRIKNRYPMVKEILIQSDNAACFSNSLNLSFIFNMNIKNILEKLPIISRWIFSEAQTGKTRLDSHFSYVNLQLSKYVNSNNKIDEPLDIYKAFQFATGITNTACVLVDIKNSNAKEITKIKTKLGVRSIHDIIFNLDFLQIRAFSELGTPEILEREIMELPNWSMPLNPTIRVHIPLTMKDMFFFNEKESVEEENSQSKRGEKIQMIIENSTCFLENNQMKAMDLQTIHGTSNLELSWAIFKSKKDPKLTSKITTFLEEIYKNGDDNSGMKSSPERAKRIMIEKGLITTIIERLSTTPMRIKGFFAKMSAQKLNKRVIIKKTWCICMSKKSNLISAYCDNPECKIKGFHLECVGLQSLPLPDETWFCPSCKMEEQQMELQTFDERTCEGYAQEFENLDEIEN